MNKSEEKGYRWLLEKKGYKKGDIVFQTRGIDFVCADGRGYEVKRLYGHTIWFYKGQLERTKGENNSVVVFADDKEEPIAVIPSMDLEPGKVISGIRIKVVDSNFRSTGIRESTYEQIKREKREGEGISKFIERILKEREGKGQSVTITKEEVEELKEVIRVAKSLVTELKEHKNLVKEKRGITKQDLIKIEEEIIDRIKDMLEALRY